MLNQFFPSRIVFVMQHQTLAFPPSSLEVSLSSALKLSPTQYGSPKQIKTSGKYCPGFWAGQRQGGQREQRTGVGTGESRGEGGSGRQRALSKPEGLEAEQCCLVISNSGRSTGSCSVKE